MSNINQAPPLQPSDFMADPFNSILRKSEAETIARNIMVILNRTGNTWRRLTWEEYEVERKKDGSFTMSEKTYFEQVIDYCVSAQKALEFCSTWA